MGRPILKFAFVLCIIACCMPGCSGGEDGDYEGVGKLVAERHKARTSQAQRKKQGSGKVPAARDKSGSSRTRDGSGLIFEEEANIVSRNTGRVLGRATVYTDKSGKIINIRVRR